jgi:Flp pilus assembly protein CpaB
VSRRARALAFLTAAVICAILAAAVAGSYSSRVAARYGPLRPVVVAGAELPAGEPIGVGAGQPLVIRRVPVRFVPPGALTRVDDALGRAPTATIPAGSYVIGAQLELPRAKPPAAAGGVGDGRRPVELAVAGADALTVGGGPPEGTTVDVVIARQAGLGNAARAYIAATNVKLLALRGPAGPGEAWSATLAVTEQQALALIGAQSAGREIRLLPRP